MKYTTGVARLFLGLLLVVPLINFWDGKTALAEQPKNVKRCFDSQYTTKAFLIDPNLNYFDNTTVWFDATTKKQRVDIRIFNPNPSDITVLLHFDTRIGYQYEENGVNCFSFALITDIEQFCFSDQASITDRPVLAGRRLMEITQPTPDGGTAVYNVIDKGASRNHCGALAPDDTGVKSALGSTSNPICVKTMNRVRKRESLFGSTANSGGV